MSRGSFHAPDTHLALSAWPALPLVPALLATNRALLDEDTLHLNKQPLAQIRRHARHEIATAARNYLKQRGEPVPELVGERLLVSGHQSELFHPGVWIKNFVLGTLARRTGSAALNLIVDNDAIKTLSLRLPVDLDNNPHIASVPFDDGPLGYPAEEYSVHNEELFQSLSRRVATPWPFRPLLADYWREVHDWSRPGDTLGARLAAGRRALERRWGCHNLELPISVLSQTHAFARFASDLLLRLSELHALYNRCVREYRTLHRIRSRHHPVPDLVQEDDWLEVPLWAWRAGQKQRGRLMVRRQSSGFALRAGKEIGPTLPLATLADSWHDLEAQGFKVRPRALMNTLFARLFVGDLFLHGIGGGTYDELTDQLMASFYGVTPPAFLVVTATLHLPFPAASVTAEQHQQLARRLRDLRYNPQRHLVVTHTQSTDIAQLLGQREDWVAKSPQDSTGKIARWRTLQQITRALAEATTGEQAQVCTLLSQQNAELRTAALCNRRDYAFCLHPQESLRQLVERATTEAQRTATGDVAASPVWEVG